MEKIIFHKETKTFHLYNEEISYIMEKEFMTNQISPTL